MRLAFYQGPWKARESHDNDWDVVDVNGNPVVREAGEVGEADAYLIAAAPELLAACLALEDELCNGGLEPDGKAVAMLHAAINLVIKP